MASGIEVPDAIVNAYKEVKQRKYSAIIIKVQNEEMILEKTFPTSSGNPADEWKEIVSGLNENECRFIVCDFQVKETELVIKGKLILIKWTPDYSPIRSKMVYASTLVNLGNKVEVQKTIQATELEDVKYDTLLDSVFCV